MLNSAYLDGKAKPTEERTLLLRFLNGISVDKHAFVSLNWDVVLEGCIEELRKPFSPLYSAEITPAEIVSYRVVEGHHKKQKLSISKMHGSINWAYCDCCRRTFSVPINKVTTLASQVLNPDQVKKLYGPKALPRLDCPYCDVDLGVRLATFSYQKALRTPPFESSWLEAEKSLRLARKWVFIGYSLPNADFEFTYMLKRVALARVTRPEVTVITVDDGTQPDQLSPVKRYQRFFGECKPKFFRTGLTSEAIQTILN